jgi:mono/diheme cytochrome c family protein
MVCHRLELAPTDAGGYAAVLKSSTEPSPGTLDSGDIRTSSGLKRSIGLAVLCFASATTLAATLDASKLPPSAKIQIDFERDIKPIFETTCLRCHGPERPKSGFRLDNRESALKGGENSPKDIIPGNSAQSPLIHYVARLVPDMEMPPPGKGTPLTPVQVGLLRAWIDQGVTWGATNVGPQISFSFAPMLGWTTVSGDKHKFREVEGIREGINGGVDEFSLHEQFGPTALLSLEGRVSVPMDDFRLKLELRNDEVGFVRAGFEQWRKYYDDTGGYYPLYSPPSFDLGRDLHLDIGRAWVDFGLTLPRLPQVVLGYEYQYKEGSKSTLEWGQVGSRNIYPASEEIHEHVHIIKADVSYEIYGFSIEDNARVEFYDLKSRHDDPVLFTTGPGPDATIHTHVDDTHIQGFNTLHVERQVLEGWLVSGGYLYSKLDGDSSLHQFTLNPLGMPVNGSFWSADTTTLKRESQVVSLANLVQPTEWVSLSVGAQAEWTRQEGFGNVNLDSGDPNLPSSFTLYPSTVESSLDTQRTSEDVALRLTAIPWTVLFADARLDQESIGQYEQDLPDAGTIPNPSTTFLRNTDYSNYRAQLRAGFSASPWNWVSLNAHYLKRTSDSDYDNTKIALDPSGYSAFIRNRSIDTDEVEAKLVLHPLWWLRTALTCQLISTDFHTTTDPVPGTTAPSGLLAGNYDAHNFGISATITPIQKLYLSGAFTYGATRISTLATAEPIIVPYKGDVYSFYGSATWAINAATDLQASYSFSRAAYGQDNLLAGLPLGLDYTRHSVTAGLNRRFSKGLSARLGYGFYRYSEPSTGGFNDYTAHGVFATMVLNWPFN